MKITQRSLDFTRQDTVKSLDNFDQNGRVYRSKLLVLSEDLKPEQAADRLERGESIFIALKDGAAHRIDTSSNLQRLDSLKGLNLKPSVLPEIRDALLEFDKGVERDDGIYRPGYAFTGDKKVDAYQAFQMLTNKEDRSTRHALIGAAIGAGVGLAASLGAAGLGFLPQALLTVPSITAAGALVGGTKAFIDYKNDHPTELHIRHGIDSNMQVHNLKETVELHTWIKDQEAHPFTREQQQQALDNLAAKVGLYAKSRKLTAEEALQRLERGQEVRVPSTVPGQDDVMTGLRQLQTMDTVRGMALNPVIAPEVASSLRWLESGSQLKDGLYKVDGGRMSAYMAVEHLLREREPIAVKCNGKQYVTKTLKNLQELNALKGDGKNTILPESQFQALKFFEAHKDLADSYAALQLMNEGQPQTINGAVCHSPQDLQELNALEYSKNNDILPQGDYDLLQFWGTGKRPYDALQSIQRREEFDIKSSGRNAPALNFQDLQDLASFEAPQAGFPDTVPADYMDRLTYFQSINEAHKQAPVRVGTREGRAYEAYRQLRDNHPADVKAGGVWNRVTDATSLHELDALLGRQVNDILPGATYELLTHLGDGASNEGLALRGSKLNSYQALQEFKQNRAVTYDFTGGDFSEPLQIPTGGLADLEQTKKRRDDQKEYDRYRYPVPEWQEKMQRKERETPKLGEANLKFGKDNLATGQHHERQGQQHLSEGQSDLRRGESELSSAHSQMSIAQMQPMYITTYHTVCDSNNNCHQESRQEYNWQRQSMINSAQSEIDDAERQIRRARQEINEAEDEIRKARREIDVANGQIGDANTLLGILPSYESTLTAVNTENFDRMVPAVKAQLEQMKRLSHIAKLDLNLRHQAQLTGNMETRPERPAGYQVPDGLVQY